MVEKDTSIEKDAGYTYGSVSAEEVLLLMVAQAGGQQTGEDAA